MEATLKRIESRDPPGQHKTPVEFLRAALIEAQKQVLTFRHEWRQKHVVKSVTMQCNLPRVCGRVRWSVPVSVHGLDRKSKYRVHTVVRMNQDVVPSAWNCHAYSSGGALSLTHFQGGMV